LPSHERGVFCKKASAVAGKSPVWSDSPRKVSRPGTSGKYGTDSTPVAATRNRARSSPPSASTTVHIAVDSSKAADTTRASNWMWRRRSNRSTTFFLSRSVSRCSAKCSCLSHSSNSSRETIFAYLYLSYSKRAPRYRFQNQVPPTPARVARPGAVCHGQRASGGVKDLRKMAKETHAQFNDLVLGGAGKDKGMASFADILSKDDAEAIHGYRIARANEDWGRKRDGSADDSH